MAGTATIGLVARRDRIVMPRWLRATAYFAYSYKRTWRGSLTVSFLYPVLYLTAMGVGLGSLVDHHVHSVGGVSYLDFLAPGLLAATAMQVGGNESTYPVMDGIVWGKTYYAMLATPLTYKDVLRGHVAWIAFRLLTVVSIYLAILAAFGVIHSDLAILAIPAGHSRRDGLRHPDRRLRRSPTDGNAFSVIYRFGLIPLFLFSGTFFPISQLPGWLQPVAYATPLYHGVALCRGLRPRRHRLAGRARPPRLPRRP